MSIKIQVQPCHKIRPRQNANPATRIKRFANSANLLPAPGKRNKTATTAKNPAPTRGRGNRINYLCIEFNPFAQPKTTSKPN